MATENKDKKEEHNIEISDTEAKVEFIKKIIENVVPFISELNGTKCCKVSIIRILIVTAAAIATIYVCLLSSQRFMNSWVETVIESTDVHVSEISFPAVTICPIENFNRLRLPLARDTFFNLNNSTASINDMDFELLLRSFYQITWFSFEDDPISQQQMDDFHYISNLPWNATIFDDLFSFISYTCEELFEECIWRRVRTNCCNIFKRIQTYKGVCFSFNSILAEDPERTWPWKLSEAGIGTGLKVKLRKNITNQYIRKIAAMIHDPSESLSTDIIYMDGERIIVAVNPLRFTATEDIQGLHPGYRHCYFMSELNSLGKSTSECIRDCRMNYIELKCNCSYFFAKPASMGYQSYPKCGPTHMKCIYKHRSVLMTTGNIMEDRVGDKTIIINCECYPNCNHIRYSTAVYSDNLGAINNNLNINFQVYYQQETLFSYHSMLPYTLLDLLVAYGGIAGFFLGLSLIGIFEALTRCIACCRKRGQVKDQNNDEYITKK